MVTVYFNDLLAVILDHAEFVTDELSAGPEVDVTTAARDVAPIQRAAERAAATTATGGPVGQRRRAVRERS